MKPHFQATDIATDREARLQSVLMGTLESVQSVEYKLALIGGISAELPKTSPELTWRLQVAQLLQQTRSLGKAIELLQAMREDVVDLSQ